VAKDTLLKSTSAVGILALAGILSIPTVVGAGEVALSSDDGTINLTGEYIGFEDEMYIIATAVGELRVLASEVKCEGLDCPVFSSETGAQAESDVFVADGSTLRFVGSDTIGEGLMPLLTEGWAASMDAASSPLEAAGPNQSLTEIVGDQGFGDVLSAIAVSSTSSERAFNSLLSGNADFGMTSRPIQAAEAESLLEAGLGDFTSPAQEHIIAVDSLVAIVHPDNPVQNLQLEQLRGIFSGQITNWNQVGGPDRVINVYDRAAGSGVRTAFMDPLFERTVQPLANAQIVDSNSQMSDSVAEDINAIGFVGYAFRRGARPMTLENECGLTVTPDSFSARTEEYEFQRRLFLYTAEDSLSATSQDFLDYVRSTDADEVIEKSGFISLAVTARAQGFDSPRAQVLLQPSSNLEEGSAMRDMLGTMISFDRLSSTFRFTTGSSELDRRAPIDMSRLADFLETAPEGTEVKFVGFTDDIGSFANNQILSEQRAEQVMTSMLSFAGTRLNNIEFSSTGFGEVSPTACT